MIRLAAAFALIAGPVAATQCGPPEVLTRVLGGTYGEYPVSRGLGSQQGNSVIMETWANPETGTWSIIVNRSDGVACLVASGEAWHVPLAPIPGEPM